jgi:hypothetical protein
MNFKEAKDKLAELANGEYHSLRYSVTEYSRITGDHKPYQECEVYINNKGWHKGDTWEEAFKSLDKILNPISLIIDNVEEL